MFHGFSENSNKCLFEMGIHHALNGFEVYMIDFKCFGYTSGARCSDYEMQHHHEQIGALLSHIKSSKPLFVYGFSSGCMNL